MSETKVSILKFGAAWCGPCRMLVRVFDEVKKEFNEVEFNEVDVEEDGDMAVEYNITSVPVVVILQDGVEVDRIIGLKQQDSYIEKIKQFAQK